MFQRLTTSCVAAVLCLGLCAGVRADATTQPSPPQAKPFQAFLQAIKNGDASGFRDCQSKQTRESNQPWQRKLEEAKSSLKRIYGEYDISRFTYGFAAGEDDDTHGLLTISYPDRTPLKMKVAKEGNDWKLASH